MPVDQTNLMSHPQNETQNNLERNDATALSDSLARTSLADSSQRKDSTSVASPAIEWLPRYSKIRRERKFMESLSVALSLSLNADDHCDLKVLGDRLAPIARAIVEHEPEGPGRPRFHYNIAFEIISQFFFEHEYEYKNGSPGTIFDVLSRVDSTSSDATLESLLHVLASFFVIAGPLIFTRPQSLRHLAHAFSSIPSGRSERIGTLRSLTWRCLVLSFSRMIDWEIFEEQFWKAALKVVEPHLSEDDVPRLVSHLVTRVEYVGAEGRLFPGARLASLVACAITMRDPEVHSSILGFNILRQLVLGGGPEDWSELTNLSLDCFHQIEALLNNVPLDQPQGTPWGQQILLRDLSLGEIDASWDFLAAAWRACVRAEITSASQTPDNSKPMELTDEILQMWRVLLHAANQKSTFREPLCNLLVSLVYESNSQGSDCNQLEEHRVRTRAIQATTKLWSVAMDELELSPRAAVAEMILQKCFERRNIYDKFHGQTMKAWNKLVEDLVFCDPESVLSALEKIRYPDSIRSVVQQQIWCDLVHFTVLAELRPAGVKSYFSISELAAFLLFPYKMRFQNMDEYAHMLWDTLKNKTFAVAIERDRTNVVLKCMEEVAELIKEKGKEQEKAGSDRTAALKL